MLLTPASKNDKMTTRERSPWNMWIMAQTFFPPAQKLLMLTFETHTKKLKANIYMTKNDNRNSIFMTGFLNVAASWIPELEFPIKNAQFFKMVLYSDKLKVGVHFSFENFIFFTIFL